MDTLNSEVKAMIYLLDDDDETVFQAVSQKLSQIVNPERPDSEEILQLMLEKKNNTHAVISEKIESLIDNIQFDYLAPLLKSLLIHDAQLEDIIFLIAQIGYPALDIDKYKKELNKIENAFHIEYYTSSMTEVNKALLLNVIIYDHEGYRGNSSNYYDPDNSYLNRVMDRKLGIPITLGALYLVIAKRLGLPIYGVNMPAHFMLKYERKNYELFIDPFNRGRILEKQDCIRFLMNAGYGYVEQYLARASSLDLCERMLNNLKNSYRELNNLKKFSLIERYLQVVREVKGKVLFQILMGIFISTHQTKTLNFN
ncbi:conserved hypothetical protein [Chloroherpeton thalassium ATCC 35110]|uniref:Protein SirB1 N-terminal domain-containing protein n=1 Tax=Chloroherpeton thalassium (strain ATCC 35110 / GB-78) TaxID=517418 RepID=B3QX23_CHLT3|nr:transglutaminase-like domain-containing protein [Chloroherpeton thalassium]ACF14833.1 conserved hypothetical protein [Chloroherpeton thalassium ATCC 35110]